MSDDKNSLFSPPLSSPLKAPVSGATPIPGAMGGASTTVKADGPVKVGHITQVIGPVIDVEFDGELPEVNNALVLTNASINDKVDNLVAEVAMHLGERTVRAISMDTTDGLVRGTKVRDTGGPIMMPVGKSVLGRIMNVIGEPVDEQGEIKTDETRPIHRKAPEFVEQSVKVEPFVT
ncbi:MAG: F0F1 ATP synthase subunit beta, partial [Myxococcales bacterium]|nr:F0F1 ATP synthase subunit beta [Myxococcales bacterium]